MSKTLTLSFAVLADRETTLAGAAAAYDKYIAERETELSTISDAVHSVFDQYKGEPLTMPILGGMTVHALNAQPGNYKSLEKRVLDFVRDNAGTRESGAAFSISKGVGGGVRRWCDVPAETPADATDSE